MGKPLHLNHACRDRARRVLDALRTRFLLRIGASCAIAGMLAGCATPSLVERGSYYADTSLHARGADSRIRFLVMHYTESDEVRALRTLTGDSVSVHYVVPPQPRIERGEPVVYQLVPESKRAWHAGVSAAGTTEPQCGVDRHREREPRAARSAAPQLATVHAGAGRCADPALEGHRRALRHPADAWSATATSRRSARSIRACSFRGMRSRRPASARGPTMRPSPRGSVRAIRMRSSTCASCS
jgi:hypothetical protein